MSKGLHQRKLIYILLVIPALTLLWLATFGISYPACRKKNNYYDAYKTAVVALASATYKCDSAKITKTVHLGVRAYQFTVDACGRTLIYRCGKFCKDCAERCDENRRVKTNRKPNRRRD